jgi:hypothetical protein
LGGRLGLDAALSAQPPILQPSQENWLRANAFYIGFEALSPPGLYKRPSSETIYLLEIVYKHGLNLSDLDEAIYAYKDVEVLKWALDKGGLNLAMYSKDVWLRELRGDPDDWRDAILQAWESQNSEKDKLSPTKIKIPPTEENKQAKEGIRVTLVNCK